MVRRRQKPNIAWLAVGLLLGVQAWVGYHKAADHHHPHHGGHTHQHHRLSALPGSLLQQLQALVAQQVPTDHSHDDHPPHRDQDHEITWAPLRKNAVDGVVVSAVLPEPCGRLAPFSSVKNEPIQAKRNAALHRPHRAHRGRAPPLIFVA